MNGKSSTKGLTKLFFPLSFIFIFLCVAAIYPLGDDWFYYTAPNFDFRLSQLLPNEYFWRPIDVLFGALLGKVPFMFPYLNRFVVILSHILTAYFTDKILIKLNYMDFARYCSVLIFTFSSAAYAVVSSPDALNQSFCLLFGVIGLYTYLKKYNFTYLFFVFLSVMSKESGIAWLAVIPLMGTVLTIGSFKNIKERKKAVIRLLICAGIAVAFVGVYFAVRFKLQGNMTLGNSSGRYSLSVFSFSTVKNYVNMFLLAATGVDTVSLLSSRKNYALVAVTVALSLVFIAYIFICFIKAVKKKDSLYTPAAILLSTFILAAPQAMIEKSGEMHAYPVLFGLACLYGYFLNYSEKEDSKKAIASIVCLFTAFTISSVNKTVCIYRFGNESKQLTQNIHEHFSDPEKSLLLVNIDFHNDYSIYIQPPVFGMDYGTALRPIFGWKDFERRFFNADDRQDALRIAEENKDK